MIIRAIDIFDSTIKHNGDPLYRRSHVQGPNLGDIARSCIY